MSPFSPCLYLFNMYFAQHFSSEEWIELVLLSLDCLSMGIWSVRRLSSLSSIVSGQYTSITRRVCFFHSTLNLFRYHNLLHFGSFFYNLSSNCRSDVLLNVNVQRIHVQLCSNFIKTMKFTITTYLF